MVEEVPKSEEEAASSQGVQLAQGHFCHILLVKEWQALFRHNGRGNKLYLLMRTGAKNLQPSLIHHQVFLFPQYLVHR